MIALKASSEIRGFLIMLCPSASEAIATARIVCDLDAGMATVPLNRDLLVCSFIIRADKFPGRDNQIVKQI